MKVWIVLISALAAGAVHAQEIVRVHPIFDQPFFSCTEHAAYWDLALGDALGSDCMVNDFVEDDGRLWLRAHTGNGHQNADWFSWNAKVLSPCTGQVKSVTVNPTENLPGVLGKPPASVIQLACESGVQMTVAHVRAIEVAQGQSVTAGEHIARVGNNGYSRHPHIHLGAWRDNEALQIIFDLSKVAPYTGQ